MLTISIHLSPILRRVVIAKFIAGVFVSILIAEFSLHAIEGSPLWRIFPIVERELGLPDAHLGYNFKPSYQMVNVRENRARITTNSLGQRDRERAMNSLQDDYRMAVRGDSYTEAIQVSLRDTFVYQTEQRLIHADLGRNVQVMNFGMSGAGPLQQLIRYQIDAATFAPELVIFVIGANDLTNQELVNDSSGPAYTLTGDSGELQIGRAYQNLITHRVQYTWYGQLFFWLMDYSRIARAVFLQYRMGNASFQPAANASWNLNCASATKLLDQHRLLWINEKPTPNYSRLEKYLDDVSTTALGQAMIAIYGLYHPPTSCPDVVAKRNEITASIRRRLNAHGADLIDLDKGLFESDPQGYLSRTFYGFGTRRGSGHLNHQGHRLYADLLTTEIQRMMTQRKK